MNRTLPDTLKAFVDEQVGLRGDGTGSEYVHELIRQDRERLHRRGLLPGGAASVPTTPVDAAYFCMLRDRAGGRVLSRAQGSVPL